jgi:hypothetical protein
MPAELNFTRNDGEKFTYLADRFFFEGDVIYFYVGDKFYEGCIKDLKYFSVTILNQQQ